MLLIQLMIAGKISKKILIKIIFYSSVFLSSSLLSTITFAIELKTPFDIAIPVEGKEENKAERTLLLQQGLKVVLVRISGSEQVATAPSIIQAINKVDDYVKCYAYQESSDNQRILQVQFSPILIKELLHHAGFQSKNAELQGPSILVKTEKVVEKVAEKVKTEEINSETKSTSHFLLNEKTLTAPENTTVLSNTIRQALVWAIVIDKEKPGKIQWLGSETEPQIFAKLNEEAKRLNLSLVFPLFDLSDAETISEQTILQQEFNSQGETNSLEALNKKYSDLLDASARYQAPNILIGKLTKESGNVKAEWMLIKSSNALEIEQNSQIEQNAVNLQNTPNASNMPNTPVTQNVQNEYQNIEHQNSEQRNNDAINHPPLTLHLAVSGIQGVHEYADIVKYLKKLPQVTQVDVTEITPEKTIFKVVTTSRFLMKEAIAKDSKLIENIVQDNLPKKSSQLTPEILNYKVSEVM